MDNLTQNLLIIIQAKAGKITQHFMTFTGMLLCEEIKKTVCKT